MKNINWKFLLLAVVIAVIFALMHVLFPGMRQPAATAEEQIGIDELNTCFLLVFVLLLCLSFRTGQRKESHN